MHTTVGAAVPVSYPASVGVDATTALRRTRAEAARVGIWTVEDLKERCFVDEFDCWHWRGAKSDGRPRIWFGPIGRSTSLGYVLALLISGKRPPKGSAWRWTCSTPHCANPAHNKAVKRSTYTANTGPSSVARTKFAATILAKTRLGPDAVAAIRGSDEPTAILAERHGISKSYVRRIRAGKCRVVAAAGFSVFSWSGVNP